MLEDNVLLKGEKIFVNDKIVDVMSTCCIEVADTVYTMVNNKHNCNIVSADISNADFLTRLPIIYLNN